MNGVLINLSKLPSKGKVYPQDIELLVKPLTAGEEMSYTLERFGSSKANYYENLLNAIEVKGDFDKNNILFGDIQYIDLYRRLISFELDEKIMIKEKKCPHCNNDLLIEFFFDEVEFEDFKEDIFNKTYQFTEDDLKIIASPITIKDFLKISRKYLSNASKPEDLTDYIFAYRAFHVKSVNEGRVFPNLEAMRNYLITYFKNLFKYKDVKVLQQLDVDMAVIVKPIKVTCSECKEEVEVILEPTTPFHQ